MSEQVLNNALHIHVEASGRITALDGNDHDEYDSGDELLKELFESQYQSVNVFGTADASSLICGLFENFMLTNKGKYLKNVYLGTPAVLKAPKNPYGRPLKLAVVAKELAVRPRHAGGWHLMTMNDYTSYSLIRSMKRNETYRTRLSILKTHPAAKVISYFAANDRLAAMRTLCTIVDPRWYTSIEHPYRKSKLHSLLGLFPRVAEKFIRFKSEHQSPRNERHSRFGDVAKAWGYNKPIGDVNAMNAVLHRVVASHKDAARGLLRASQMYVDILSDMWLANLHPHIPDMFRPESMFNGLDNSDALVRSFKSHVR
jgi:hypothetical protein